MPPLLRLKNVGTLIPFPNTSLFKITYIAKGHTTDRRVTLRVVFAMKISDKHGVSDRIRKATRCQAIRVLFCRGKEIKRNEKQWK